jgi:histidinol-phosphate phosphatase family protein
LAIILQNKAVFIDRDDTINKDVPYCSRPEDFVLLPEVGPGIRLLREAGFKIVVVTNQSGIARGYFTHEVLKSIHAKMQADLGAYNAFIDAIFYCPHHPDDNCDCRKPKPKMINDAALEMNIDITQSYVIGDSDKDVEMSNNAGCKKGLKVNYKLASEPSKAVFNSFLEAVSWILSEEKD